jgi:hypothetical protein
MKDLFIALRITIPKNVTYVVKNIFYGLSQHMTSKS